MQKTNYYITNAKQFIIFTRVNMQFIYSEFSINKGGQKCPTSQ